MTIDYNVIETIYWTWRFFLRIVHSVWRRNGMEIIKLRTVLYVNYNRNFDMYEITVRLDDQYRCNRYHQSLICPNTRSIFSQTSLYLYLAYLSHITINRIVPFPIIPCASVSRWRIKYLNSNQISKIWCCVAKKKEGREKREREKHHSPSIVNWLSNDSV